MDSVISIIESAIITNVSKSDQSSISGKEKIELKPADFGIEENRIQVSEVKRDPFKELDSLIGLDSVKEHIRDISSYLSLQIRRQKLKLPINPICTHMVFTGNPGTGKTTVARLIGEIFKEIGLYEENKFIETAREDLVGQYIGHTAPRVAKKVDEATPGVLYIDEAYSLYTNDNKDFGYEAIATLVKRMEDERNSLTVIFSGYEEEMNRFITMNPGLKDRIQFNINFPDYTPDEMMKIYQRFCVQECYQLEETCEDMLYKIFELAYVKRDQSFSNARFVRKLFQSSKLSLARRLQFASCSKYEMSTIKIQDVQSLHGLEYIKPLIAKEGKNCSKMRIGFLACNE